MNSKKFYSDSWPPFVKRVIQSIKFVAGVGPGQKLCFNNQSYVPADGINSFGGIMGSALRYVMGEDKTGLVQHLEEIKIDAFELFHLYESKDDNIRTIIYKSLLKFEDALKRLMDVYSMEFSPTTHSSLETLHTQIAFFLENNHSKVHIYDEEEESDTVMFNRTHTST